MFFFFNEIIFLVHLALSNTESLVSYRRKMPEHFSTVLDLVFFFVAKDLKIGKGREERTREEGR